MNNQNIIICGRREDPFARVSKSLLNDPSISWKAKGIVAYLLGKPPEWKLRVNDLVNHSRDGKASVWAALRELRKAGYADLIKVRTSKGRVDSWTWKISDCPIFTKDKPDTDFRDVENPDVDNRYHSKNDSYKEGGIERKSTGRISNEMTQLDKILPVKKRNYIAREYPESEEEMYETLEALGIECSQDYDGSFYQDMLRRGWRDEHGETIKDWANYYRGRFQHIEDKMGWQRRR